MISTVLLEPELFIELMNKFLQFLRVAIVSKQSVKALERPTTVC